MVHIQSPLTLHPERITFLTLRTVNPGFQVDAELPCLLRNVSIYQFSNLKHSKALWMGWSRLSLQDQRVFTIRLTTTLTNGFSDALTLSNWQSYYHRT